MLALLQPHCPGLFPSQRPQLYITAGAPAATYYSSLIAWALFYLGASFRATFPWSITDCASAADPAACAADPARSLPFEAAARYFAGKVTREDRAALDDGSSDVTSTPLIGSALLRICLLAGCF